MNSQLHVLDYVVMFTTVLVSSAAGFYYGVIRKKNDSVEEYFMASRELSIFKMACSLFATVMSSGALVGLVAEIFYYGSQSMLGFVGGILSRIICNFLFFPVFYSIGSHDIYKYYELRFNKYVRYFLSTLTIIEMIFIDSVVIYGASIVISKASGVELWIIILTITVICAVYSALGGVRGVTIADVMQGCVIVVTIVILFVLSLIHVGGFSVAWQRNMAGERIEFFNFDVNPKVRQSFWTAIIAHLVNITATISTSQTSLMRLMATKSLERGIRASYIGSVMISVVYFLCGLLGLLVYATYYLCDPISSKQIKSPNQLIAKFVGDVMSGYHGLPGLFYSALLCAAISTLSSHFNALSVLTMETFVKPFNFVKSDQGYTLLAKISTFVAAGLALICTFCVQSFPNIYQASIVLSSVSNGPHFALLLIGIFFPQSNLKSSIGALGCGVVFMLWILVGSLFLKSTSITKPITTIGCVSTVNTSMNVFTELVFTNNSYVSGNFTTSSSYSKNTLLPSVPWATYFPLSVASHNWFTSIGILLTLGSFVILTFVFGADKEHKVDIKLIPTPVQNLQRKYNKKLRRLFLCDIYNDSQEMKVIHSVGDTLPEVTKPTLDN